MSQNYFLLYTVHSNRIFISMTLSSLKHRFTNLCKSPVFEFAVLKFTVKIAIYKPMQIRGFKICGS